MKARFTYIISEGNAGLRIPGARYLALECEAHGIVFRDILRQVEEWGKYSEPGDSAPRPVPSWARPDLEESTDHDVVVAQAYERLADVVGAWVTAHGVIILPKVYPSLRGMVRYIYLFHPNSPDKRSGWEKRQWAIYYLKPLRPDDMREFAQELDKHHDDISVVVGEIYV